MIGYPLGRNPKLNELMQLVAVEAAREAGNGCDIDIIRRHADRAAQLWEDHQARHAHTESNREKAK